MGAYKSEIVTLTPEKAREWLESCAFEGQRSLRKNHVAYLVNELLRDRLEPDQIVLCDLNGKSYLTDGQHRLAAVVEADKDAVFSVLRRKCKSLAEVEEDYRRRDRGLSRTMADCLSPSSALREIGLNPRQIAGFAGAFQLIKSGFQPVDRTEASARSVDVRSKFLNDWASQAIDYFDSLKAMNNSKDKMIGYRSAVVAVGIVTFKHQPAKAKEFWDSTAEDDGLTKGMPQKALLTFLRNSNAADYPVHLYARYVASAWNAFYDKREVGTCRALASYNPITIKGTPHKGDEPVEMRYE